MPLYTSEIIEAFPEEFRPQVERALTLTPPIDPFTANVDFSRPGGVFDYTRNPDFLGEGSSTVYFVRNVVKGILDLLADYPHFSGIIEETRSRIERLIEREEEGPLFPDLQGRDKKSLGDTVFPEDVFDTSDDPDDSLCEISRFKEIFDSLQLDQGTRKYLLAALFRENNMFHDPHLIESSVDILTQEGATGQEIAMVFRCVCSLDLESAECLDSWVDDSFVLSLLRLIRLFHSLSWNNRQILDIISSIAFYHDSSDQTPCSDFLEDAVKLLEMFCECSPSHYSNIFRIFSEVDPSLYSSLSELFQVAGQSTGFDISEFCFLSLHLAQISLPHDIDRDYSGFEIMRDQIQFDAQRKTNDFRHVHAQLFDELKSLTCFFGIPFSRFSDEPNFDPEEFLSHLVQERMGLLHPDFLALFDGEDSDDNDDNDDAEAPEQFFPELASARFFRFCKSFSSDRFRSQQKPLSQIVREYFIEHNITDPSFILSFSRKAKDIEADAADFCDMKLDRQEHCILFGEFFGQGQGLNDSYVSDEDPGDPESR